MECGGRSWQIQADPAQAGGDPAMARGGPARGEGFASWRAQHLEPKRRRRVLASLGRFATLCRRTPHRHRQIWSARTESRRAGGDPAMAWCWAFSNGDTPEKESVRIGETTRSLPARSTPDNWQSDGCPEIGHPHLSLKEGVARCRHPHWKVSPWATGWRRPKGHRRWPAICSVALAVEILNHAILCIRSARGR